MSTEEKVVEETIEKTQEETKTKNTKAEKKFRKAMCKLGLKPVEGINRVTIKTNKGMFLYIDKPEVMKSEGGYLVFGETKFLDVQKQMGNEEVNKYKEGEKLKDEEVIEEVNEDEGDEVEEELGDLKEEDVENLMTYNNISRNKAIKVLKKAGGDLVEAISLLENN